MKPVPHIAVSCVISAGIGIYFRSFWCAAISFACGVLIDLDHLVDYYATHPPTLKLSDIYDACAEVRLNKLYFLLHSYELIAAQWLAIYTFSLSNAWKAAAIGLTQHIIFDQLTNPVKPLAYFLTYRVYRKFDPYLLHRELENKCRH